MIVVPVERTWDDWRNKARELLAQEIPPELIEWHSEAGGFVFGEPFVDRQTPSDIRFPRDFIQDARVVSAYRDDTTWALLYRIAWRIQHEDRRLLHIAMDPDVREFQARRHAVSRDLHKMHAFVRFREVKEAGESVFMAWHRSDHRVLRLAAPFFKDRFNGMNWVIMTEDESMAWDQQQLSYLPGVRQHELPPDDKEELWKTYYSSIFNPARVKVGMMKQEMAVRYWNTMPETELISELLQKAPQRVEEFLDAHQSVARPAPVTDLATLHQLLRNCRACGICQDGRMPSLGQGPATSTIAIVGELHRDQSALRSALELAGINPAEVYLTHAVKGDSFGKATETEKQRGPSAREISACRPWVQAELKILRPQLLICVGKTAAQSVVGRMINLAHERGQFFSTPSCDQTIIIGDPKSESFHAELGPIKVRIDQLKAQTSSAVGGPR